MAWPAIPAIGATIGRLLKVTFSAGVFTFIKKFFGKGFKKITVFLEAIYNFLMRHKGATLFGAFTLLSGNQFLSIQEQITDKLNFIGRMFQIDDLLRAIDNSLPAFGGPNSALNMTFSQSFSAMGGIACVNLILTNIGIALSLFIFFFSFTIFMRLLVLPSMMKK